MSATATPALRRTVWTVVLTFLALVLTTAGAQGAQAAPLLVPAAGAAGVTIPGSLTIPASLAGVGVVEGVIHYGDEVKGVARSAADGVWWGIEESAELYGGAALFAGRTVGLVWNWATGKGPGGDVDDYDPPAPVGGGGSVGWQYVGPNAVQQSNAQYIAGVIPPGTNMCIGDCLGPFQNVNTWLGYGSASPVVGAGLYGGTGFVPDPAPVYNAQVTEYRQVFGMQSPAQTAQQWAVWDGVYRNVYCRNQSTGAVKSINEGPSPGSGAVYGPGKLAFAIELQINCGAGWGFDHIAIRNPTQGFGTAWYIPGGHPRHVGGPTTPTGPAGETPVTTTPRSKCSDGSIVEGTPITYKGNTPSAELPPMVFPACPAGTRRTGADAPSKDGTGREVPSPMKPWQPKVVPDAYAECNPALGKACVLVLKRAAPDGSTVTCNNTGLCVGWSSQLTPEVVATGPGTITQHLPDGSTRTVRPPQDPQGRSYFCTWGPYNLPVAECKIVPVKPPTGAPKPPPETDPGSNCNGGDFSLNPVSWVVVPLKCLFIPRQPIIQGHTTKVGTAWGETAPGVVVGAVADVFSPIASLGPGSSSCLGPNFSIPLPLTTWKWSLHPFSACGPVLAYASNIFLNIQTFGIYLGAFALGVRRLTRTIGLDSPLDA